MESSPEPEPLAMPADPFIGREIAGKYRIVRRLGAGGMGAVYRATHLATGGDIAIKFLHGTALGDENAVRRFQLEAQNAAALKHVNTVRVMDFGVDHGTFYLVMEYLEGHPLSDVLMREGPLPWRRAADMLRQVLKSLWEAHEHPKRIVHRDIKPANIHLVDMPGQPDHVRVLDFGVSRALDGSGAGTQGLIGTPFYMAPELWKGEAVDARTDLYALGCVAYQMLSGAPPFVAPPSARDSIFPLFTMHVNQAARPLSDVRAEVPAPIAAWVDTLLAKDPNARPPSARAALEALDAAVMQSAIAAAPTPPVASPEALAATVDAAAPVTPAAPVAPLTAKPRPPKPAAARAPTPVRPKRGMPAWVIAVVTLVIVAGIVAAAVALSAGRGTPGAPAGAEGGDRQNGLFAPDDPAWGDLHGGEHAPDLEQQVATYGNLVVAYRARLSRDDHLDDDGNALDDAAAIVVADRIRYHAGDGDSEDGFEAVFREGAVQAQLYRLVDAFIDDDTRRAIIDGTPLVDVSIYERGLTVAVVPP